MDPFLKRLVEAIQKDGIHGGDMSADAFYLPNYTEYHDEEVCSKCDSIISCKYDRSHLGLVSIEPELSDFEEEPEDDVKEQVFDAAVYEHPFENLPEGKTEFDFTHDEFLELIEIEPDFEETLIEKYEEHHAWMDHRYEDLRGNMRRHVWPVYLYSLGEIKRSPEEIATLVHRATSGYVYLVHLNERHRPVDMQTPHGFVAADAASDDITFKLAMAYVCAQQYPPLKLVTQDFVREITTEKNMHDGTLGWCVMHSLRALVGALESRAEITEEIIGTVNSWLDNTPMTPVKHMKDYENMEAFTRHRNAIKLKEARAVLSMLGITTEGRPEE